MNRLSLKGTLISVRLLNPAFISVVSCSRFQFSSEEGPLSAGKTVLGDLRPAWRMTHTLFMLLSILR